MPQTLEISKALKQVKSGKRGEKGFIAERIDHLLDQLAEYSAQPSNRKPIFVDEQTQTKEVASRQQAIGDLVKRALAIHETIDKKNLATTVQTSLGEFTMAALVRLQNRYLDIWIKAYSVPGDAAKQAQMLADRVGGDSAAVTRYFDEQKRITMLTKLREFRQEITGLLDAVNNAKEHEITIPD